MTREAFISHVKGCQRALRRFLTGLCCGDTQLADDIAQETFMKAYLSSDGFRNPDRFTSWIFRIGYTTFLNHRRSLRPQEGFDNATGLISPYPADAPFRYQELYAAMRRLSDTERTSLLLFYMEGYSIREIAEIEDSTEDAVKKHLSRGRAHLRNILKKD